MEFGIRGNHSRQKRGGSGGGRSRLISWKDSAVCLTPKLAGWLPPCGVGLPLARWRGSLTPDKLIRLLIIPAKQAGQRAGWPALAGIGRQGELQLDKCPSTGGGGASSRGNQVLLSLGKILMQTILSPNFFEIFSGRYISF